MKKSEFIGQVLKGAAIRGRSPSRDDLEKILMAFCDVAAAELLGGGEILLPRLGKLKVRTTKNRRGRNPRTGEEIEIPARRKVFFQPSRDFREALR